MSFSDAFDRFLFLLSVPTCVSCKTRLDYGQKAICPKCSAEFEEIKTRNCSKCAQVLSECNCTPDYLKGHFVKGVVKCFRYDAREDHLASNSLIYSLKRDNRSDVLKKCTIELATAIENSLILDNSYVITNVPRRRSSIIKYGIDHSEILAKSIAKHFGVSYIKTLKSKAKAEQKSLSRDERLKNTDFYLITNVSLKDKNIIIVDDIITTGASIAASATLIKALGPKNIYAASLAIAYRDDT